MNEHDLIALTCDLPEYGLRTDDVGTIVNVYENEKGYEVEFVTLIGDTVAIVTLLPDQVRSITPSEVAMARPRAG
jgi:hypothetical protein